MPLSVLQIIQVIAPDLYTNADRDAYISMAEEQTNACFFGTKYNRAVALRAAHMWKLDQDGQAGGGVGEVASKSEGDLSISYHKSESSAGGGSKDLSLTYYGIQLQSLIKAGPGAVSVTGSGGAITNICGG